MGAFADALEALGREGLGLGNGLTLSGLLRIGFGRLSRFRLLFGQFFRLFSRVDLRWAILC